MITKGKFLQIIDRQWTNEGDLMAELNIQTLLDDALTLDVKGATDIYFVSMKLRRKARRRA